MSGTGLHLVVLKPDLGNQIYSDIARTDRCSYSAITAGGAAGESTGVDGFVGLGLQIFWGLCGHLWAFLRLLRPI